MNYEEYGGCVEGLYFSKFMEKDVADKHRDEEEPEEGVRKSYDKEEDELY